jgi:hypothetical protein
MGVWLRGRAFGSHPKGRGFESPHVHQSFSSALLRGEAIVKDVLCDGFQETVGSYLVRHRSILDVMTKLTEANGRVNRAVAKAVTNCGCVEVDAGKQKIPPDLDSLENLKTHMSTHLKGKLCEHCTEVLEDEIGRNLFYLAALCNILNLNLHDILLKEKERVACLGMYNFS